MDFLLRLLPYLLCYCELSSLRLTIWEYFYFGTLKELSVLWLYCWITPERLIALLNENSNFLKVVYEPGDTVLSMIKYKSMCMESKKTIWKKPNDLQTPHHCYGWWQLFGLLGYVLELVCCYWLLVIFLYPSMWDILCSVGIGSFLFVRFLYD